MNAVFYFVFTLVYAMDGAFPARYDMATVLVYVMDVNDNNPTFAPPSVDITLPENQSPGVIHNAIATDADEGPNGDLIYSITGKHDWWHFMKNNNSSCYKAMLSKSNQHI